MTKRELYNNLAKYLSTDMIIVNDSYIIKNEDLTDDWFGLENYSDDEELFEDYYFGKVSFVDIDSSIEKFEDDYKVYCTKFIFPAGGVKHYNIVKIIFKY